MHGSTLHILITPLTPALRHRLFHGRLRRGLHIPPLSGSQHPALSVNDFNILLSPSQPLLDLYHKIALLSSVFFIHKKEPSKNGSLMLSFSINVLAPVEISSFKRSYKNLCGCNVCSDRDIVNVAHSEKLVIILISESV